MAQALSQLMRPKAPTEQKDYAWDWSGELDEGETIATFTPSVTDGDVTVSDTLIDGVYTVARIVGGTSGTNAFVLGTITTSNNQTLVFTLEIPIRDR